MRPSCRFGGASDEQTLRRELAEEGGLTELDLGPLLWELSRWNNDEPG